MVALKRISQIRFGFFCFGKLHFSRPGTFHRHVFICSFYLINWEQHALIFSGPITFNRSYGKQHLCRKVLRRNFWCVYFQLWSKVSVAEKPLDLCHVKWMFIVFIPPLIWIIHLEAYSSLSLHGQKLCTFLYFGWLGSFVFVLYRTFSAFLLLDSTLVFDIQQSQM